MRRKGLLAAGVLFLGGCAIHSGAIRTGYDFSKVKRISVLPFEGKGGPEATDACVRELVGLGFQVTDARHPGDLVLSGTVTEYKADKTVLVYLGKTSLMTPAGQTLEVVNPAVSLSSSQNAPEGTFIGVPKGQVASVSASVAVSAQLVDPATRRGVWTDSYSYEAMDLAAALKVVAGVLTGSFGKMIPHAAKPQVS